MVGSDHFDLFLRVRGVSEGRKLWVKIIDYR